MKRFASTGEGGHVGSGEVEAVALDGDAAADFHTLDGRGASVNERFGPAPLAGTCAFRHNRREHLCHWSSFLATVVVTSSNPGEGKTGVAAAIAQHFAYLGRPVRLIRAGSGSAAERDAAWFGSLDFVPGSHSVPVEAATIGDDADALLVVEADAADAEALGGPKVVVASGNGGAAPGAAVTVRTGLRCATAGEQAGADSAPVIELVEDRTLAGFSFEEVRDLLHAQTIVEGDPDPPTCDYLVIAPIASDAGQPYFRRFHTKAVVVRYDRTDMHLAAMQADPSFLVLTGGRQPSGYLFDAAGAKGIPVLLSANDTENTVMALESLHEHTHFRGERKLNRMAALLEEGGLYTTLAI
jgi:hypothetical protein